MTIEIEGGSEKRQVTGVFVKKRKEDVGYESKTTKNPHSLMRNNMSTAVSVIVPVYNSEKYLDQCVQSLINQTLKEVEFIFVDDGSTDSSVQILEKYQSTDGRIKIIKQQNQFAGVARNNGMKAAIGKYLMFLDSDDFFELNMLEKLFKTAEQNKTDIVVFGYNTYDKKIISRHGFEEYANRLLSPFDFGNKIFQVLPCFPWNKLLLSSFVNDSKLQFQDIYSSNDEFFSRMVVVKAKRIFCLEKYFVNYRINPESLQGKRRQNCIKGYNCFALALMKIKTELIRQNLFSNLIEDSYSCLVTKELEGAFKKVNFEEQVVLLYDYLKQNLVPNLYQNADIIPKDSVAFSIYCSQSITDFLLMEYIRCKSKLELAQKDFIPRTSKSYIVGNAILSIPRIIRNFFKKK